MPKRKHGHKYGLRGVNFGAAGEVIFCHFGTSLSSIASGLFPNQYRFIPPCLGLSSPPLLLCGFGFSFGALE